MSRVAGPGASEPRCPQNSRASCTADNWPARRSDATLEILANRLPTNSTTALAVLLDNARRKTFRIWAENATALAASALRRRRVTDLASKPRRMPGLFAGSNLRETHRALGAGIISTELSYPHHVRSTPVCDRGADVRVRQLRARTGHCQMGRCLERSRGWQESYRRASCTQIARS